MARCNECIHKEICQFYNALGCKVLCQECGFFINQADVVEVRCKDCKYWDCGRCEGIQNGLIYENTHPYDYCSYGERKE